MNNMYYVALTVLLEKLAKEFFTDAKARENVKAAMAYNTLMDFIYDQWELQMENESGGFRT